MKKIIISCLIFMSLLFTGCSEAITHNYTQRIYVDSSEKVITILNDVDKMMKDKRLILTGVNVYRDTFKRNGKRYFLIVIQGNNEGEILKMED